MYNTMSRVARTIYVEVGGACEYVCLLLLCGCFFNFCLSLCFYITNVFLAGRVTVP